MVKNPPANAEDTAWVRKIALEKEMATHSSFLAWRIPRTEKPRGTEQLNNSNL